MFFIYFTIISLIDTQRCLLPSTALSYLPCILSAILFMLLLDDNHLFSDLLYLGIILPLVLLLVLHPLLLYELCIVKMWCLDGGPFHLLFT